MADLDTDGLYPVTWDSRDGCDCSLLMGSPQDAQGRGILLTITRDGAGEDLPSRMWVGDDLPSVMRPGSGVKPLSGSGLTEAAEAADWLLNTLQGTLCKITSVTSSSVGYEAVLDWAALQGVTATTMDIAAVFD